MKRLLAILSLALLLVSGCSPPDHGTVVEKRHHDAYTWVQLVCAAYGKGGVCSVYVPITHYVPESWELCLRDGDDTGCRNVDHDTYDHYRVGDFYRAPDQ